MLNAGYLQLMNYAPAAGIMPDSGAFNGAALRGLLNSPERANSYICRGTIKHSTPGFFGYVVELSDGTCVSCVPSESGPGAAYGLGVSEASVFTPGMEVVVLQGQQCDSVGVILCAYSNQLYTDSDSFKPLKSDESSGISYSDEKVYSQTQVIKDIMRTPSVGMYKSDDLFPGDWMMSNEFGAEYFLGRTRLTIRGSNMSRIDLFPINDVFRAVAGYFQFYTHGGKTLIFSEPGGYVSCEKLFSPYIWETAGCSTPDELNAKISAATDSNSTDSDSTDSDSSTSSNPDKARYREYLGSVAGGKQIFISYPDKDGNLYGLSHIALSDSGALIFRSVSDIIFSRTAKIDVPERIRNPESREDDEPLKISDKDEVPSEDDWWVSDSGKRTASNTISQLYKRFKDNDKDWKIHSKKPTSDYDSTSNSRSDIAKNTSQIILGADGSITLSTAQGAEIKLYKGDITISCPGKLSFKAGKEISFISNGDIISKAKKDVELLAKRNVSASAGQRVAAFGSKSLFFEAGNLDDESKAKGFGDGALQEGIFMISNANKVKSKTGESENDGKKSRIFIESDDLEMHVKRRATLSSINEKGKAEDKSYFLVGTKSVVMDAEQLALIQGADSDVKSGFILSRLGNCTLFADKMSVIGNKTARFMSSKKVAKMEDYDNEDENQYSNLCHSYARIFDILGRYNDRFNNVIHFSYKTYQLAGDGETNGGLIDVEESPWVRIKNVDSESGGWGEDIEVNGTVPWPGKGKRVVVVKQDLSKSMTYDDSLGDKQEQLKNKPKVEHSEFKDYRG